MAFLDNKEVGERLKNLREKTLFEDVKGNKKPLTNNAFAVRAKVDSSQYSKIEKGELPVTEAIVKKLEDTYGFNKDYILFGKIVPNKDEPEPGKDEKTVEQENITDTIDMPPATMSALLKLIDANHKLADSHKNTSESALLLTKMLAEERATTANAPQQIQSAFDSKYSDLLELIAEVASGETKYRSKKEAIFSLSKRFHDKPQKTA